MLGLLALAVVAPQAFIVLAVQRRVTALVRGRVRIIQRTSDALVAEAAEVVQPRQDADEIYDIQRRINRLKQGSKFALNALSTLGLVAILALGGWLVPAWPHRRRHRASPPSAASRALPSPGTS